MVPEFWYGRSKFLVKKNYTLGCEKKIIFFKYPEFWFLNFGMVAVTFWWKKNTLSRELLCHIMNSKQKSRRGDLFSTREKCARKDREHSISYQRATVVVSSDKQSLMSVCMQKVCKIYSWIFASIFDFVEMTDKPQVYDGIEILQFHSQSNLKAETKTKRISKSTEVLQR